MKSTESTKELIKLVIKLINFLSKKRQKQLLILLVLMLLSAISEVISLGAVIPFLGVLVAPEKIFSNPLISNYIKEWGITNSEQLILPLTIVFSISALIAGTIKIIYLWASNRLAFACGADLGIDIYKRTLYQPYSIHISRNSSEVISGITTKVNGVVFGVLIPLLTLISSAIILIAIAITLYLIDPKTASIAAFVFGGSYFLITILSKKRLNKNSVKISTEQTKVVKVIQEGLGGIRDLILDGTQEVYVEIYKKADKRLRSAQGNNAFIGQSPRYIMEALGMVLIAGFAYALNNRDGEISTALPVLGALALGAQRLLPALQQIYYAWTNIAGSNATIKDAILLLEQPIKNNNIKIKGKTKTAGDICIDNVSFSFSEQEPCVIKNINVNIRRGSIVGLIGKTGSGKSTLLDVVMGLLEPTHGQVLVNGRKLKDEEMRDWQNSIAHVPQNIYLSDATIAENIAFGEIPENIDLNRVKRAAVKAQIDEFIENSVLGYNTKVGERGIRLSGGQRQRIGIARALYKKAEILVLDEATSALDNETELKVMKEIEKLKSGLTVLIIAHRTSTLKHCDIIIKMESGEMIQKGTYKEIIE